MFEDKPNIPILGRGLNINGLDDYVKRKEDYKKSISRREDFLCSLSYNISSAIPPIIIIAFSLINGYFDFEDWWKMLLLFAGLFFALKITFFIPVILSIPIKPLLKLLIPKPKFASTTYDIFYETYLHEKSNYEDNLLILKQKYIGLEDFSYDFDSYVKWHVLEYAKELVRKQEKEFLYKLNRNRREWWLGLSGYAFEYEVCKYLSEQGYEAKTTAMSSDGGVDVIATKDGEKVYVQCKHYLKGSIPVNVVRELYGVMSVDNVLKGILACIYGNVTKECKSFMEKSGISILSLDDLCPDYDNLPANKPSFPILDDKYLVKCGNFYIKNDLFVNQSLAEKYQDIRGLDTMIDKYCFTSKQHARKYCYYFVTYRSRK